MWTQLVDANRLNNIGPEVPQGPSERFIERERQHAERLRQLEKLRAARLARPKKGRGHA